MVIIKHGLKILRDNEEKELEDSRWTKKKKKKSE